MSDHTNSIVAPTDILYTYKLKYKYSNIVQDTIRGKHIGICLLKLTHLVTLGQHLFLSNENLLSGDLNTQVTTSNHDAITLLNDGVNVLAALVVFNLANDLDVLPFLT